MAKSDYAEKVVITNSITGNYNKSKQLFWQMKAEFSRAISIDFIVSFLMESGVKMILPDLRAAVDRGVRIRILTGRYLGLTQPTALYLLKREFGDKVDLRFYNSDKGQSFHPKAYFFHKSHGSDVFIGSSNISFSALTDGVEWNYRLNSNHSRQDFDEFFVTFEDLFNNHSIEVDEDVLKEYAKNWHRPAISKDLEQYEFKKADNEISFNTFEPRGVQVEALYALEQTRREGADKGLIQAATGIGKTYLAAFDSKNYKHVLFVAHREEILNQAAKSFKNVRSSNDYGFFTGEVHDTDKSVIFASVASLGKDEYLNKKYFYPDYFDYIVVDEFHHAVNNQYRKIINYFKPDFLLGLTATPERSDGRSIYEICDYNVPYEIDLFQAINRGILVPFHYYGIYDDTDYSGLRFVNGNYIDSELDEIYLGNEKRNTILYKHYMKYHSKRALGFCCSRAHAEYMAKVFSQKGIPSVAVYSNANGEYSESRKVAIRKLEEGSIKIIFSVDMFNEGVDIPDIDTVMFLRPTQSSIVFIQQLGRGLRTTEGKEYLNVLDFIGNYRNAGKNISLLSHSKSVDIKGNALKDPDYPDGCIVDFDMQLIDLFERIKKNRRSIHETIQTEFFRIKDLLGGRVPTRMDLFTHIDADIYSICINNTKENPFKNYLGFLNSLDLLSEKEKVLYNSSARDFLNVLERTSMTKSYKMPVLYSFIQDGVLISEVNEKTLLSSWKKFFAKNGNWKDLPRATSFEAFLSISDKDHLNNIKKNPVHFLMESASDFFVSTPNSLIALDESIRQYLNNPVFVSHYVDIVNYRTIDYYSRRYRDKSSS